MITPPRWRPLPSAVGLDPRVRYVSPAACRAWLLLVCASDVGGVVRGAAGMEAASIVAAVVGCPEIEAAGLLGELEDADLVTAHPTHLHLPDVAAWSADCTPGARPAPETSPAAVSPSPRPAREIALARLRSSFSKRSLATVEARRAWLATDDGQGRLGELGLSAEDGETLAGTAGRRGGRFGRERPAVVAPRTADVATVVAEPATAVAHGCSATTASAVATAVASSPLTLPSETGKSRGEGVSDARPPVVASAVAHGCSATTETAVASKPPTLTTPWSVLVESAGGQIDGLTADATAQAAINATLAEKIEAEALTLGDLRAFGADVAAKGAKLYFPRIKGKRATARDVRGWDRDCAPLLEALSAWRDARAQPARTATPATPRPKRVALKPLTEERENALRSLEKTS